MLKKILLVVLGLVVVLTATAFLLPSSYLVERSIVIAAEPAAIYGHAADLESWPKWTAWTRERDPECEWTFAGGPGQGAVMTWSGEELGQGEVEITAGDPASGIEYALAFDDGAYVSNGDLRFEPDGAGTRVTWTNEGDLGNNPINRWMGLLMDKFMGAEFQTGLEGLKSISETSGAETPAGEPDPTEGGNG